MLFGLIGKKTTPAAAPVPAGDANSVGPVAPSGYMVTAKVTAMAVAAVLLQKIVVSGVDSTPLAALPPAAKLAISVAAPTLLAYFMRQPQLKK